ncbi:hypothetical protein [Streptosporangium sp. NBC_01756]|uniref:hypothetical protein n=1 Tax=Streptosporangium sp. NBC_01756 TaxID=2975950 RepID=UPI003FA3D163
MGAIRGARMSVGVDAFPPAMSHKHAWTFDPSAFTQVLSVYGGHFGDLLFHAVSFPEKLTAVAENQFPVVTIEETGQQVPYSSPKATGCCRWCVLLIVRVLAVCGRRSAGSARCGPRPPGSRPRRRRPRAS